ncbi:DUF692 domain-containing protein [Anaeromyxobacter sp. Fw109-5]|uniref:UPF0276 protein Anae109_1558 n=1 Tax=Anaeromyxobacter sp. (strain Fw109-5) TaxID=404589 RepID=Y1558_ANADF|nr:DUF692 domain-containing protein [Anaeromyxobacter sp. Fw109-5]A7HAL6.1 RecName: Full=UPF0276 protein Anae109_1558 [Anaeromyxobacter sp. Fw109-5]ABS25762.1 protein of unknown function DUF692 [Anaeromyxobacter sp. Fw109-5]
MAFTRRLLGHGVGLRAKHFAEHLAVEPPVDWVEAISENFMAPGGRPLAVLEKVRRDVPVVLHGVSLSIGSTDPLSERYLALLTDLTSRIEPAWISDHLCWGSHGGRYAHDLWPLPYTEEALRHVVRRILRVQEVLGRQLLLENVSSYVAFRASEMPEWEFLAEVARRADCGILLDVNNVYVSARNHGFDPYAYLAALPASRIGQIHLAGHSDKGRYLLDTHGEEVPAAVWELYAETVRRFGRISTLIEWDDHVPPLGRLVQESRRAAEVEAAALAALQQGALP